jgi:signal transduction histidine kinase
MSDLHPHPSTAESHPDLEEKASHLAFVAHEIRNPLSTALWSVELLARMTPEERGGARGEKLSRMSLRALSRLRRLVEDHLLAARLDVGGIPVEVEEIPAREIFPGAAVLGASSLELELESGLAVVADPGLARRAVEGLLLAAARDSADVRVIGTRRGRMARFRVTGAPASAADLADPLRGHAGDTRGAALAPSVSRRASALLGGSIRVEGDAWVLELPAPDVPKGQS